MRSVMRSLLTAWVLVACGESTLEESDESADFLASDDELGGVNAPAVGECVPLTEGLDHDYVPGRNDSWPECISDSGEFVPIGESISASARTLAIGEIGELIFQADEDASPEAFIRARMLYDEDAGLGSRMARRYDPHYVVEGDVDCTVAADVARNPDYCVGPAKILPIVLRAFKNGYEGIEPRFHAGRIEGALLWFSAISEYKETLSCSAEDIKDCDSAYGYYDAAGQEAGLGGYIKEVDPDAHAAARLGALAVRCWRDVDPDLPATDLALRERARTQFDRAVLKGVVSVLLERIDQAAQAVGEAQKFHWGFVSAFLGAIQSQSFRSSGSAELIAEARAAPSPAAVDTEELKLALQGIVECE
jgi:hypothetical protein